MTDKEKIKVEIERRLKWYEDEIAKYMPNIVPDYEAKKEECKNILDVIDSLPEEPVSEDLLGIAMELEETIGTSPHSRLTVVEHLVKATDWQKQQMMKDAVDADVLLDYYDSEDREVDVVMADNVFADEHGITDEDKVKIIIVKED